MTVKTYKTQLVQKITGLPEMSVIVIFIFQHHMLFCMCFHDEGMRMMCKMTVQNTVNLASSSAHYLFYLSVSCIFCYNAPRGHQPIKIYRLAASVYRPQRSKHVKKVVVYSPEITVALFLPLSLIYKITCHPIYMLNKL